MAPSLFLDVRFNQLTPRAQAIVLSARWQRRLRLEQQLEPPWNMQTLLHRCVSNGWGLAHRCQRDARLMPAKYVRPYSKGQKNDFRDAEALAEAVQRRTTPRAQRQ